MSHLTIEAYYLWLAQFYKHSTEFIDQSSPAQVLDFLQHLISNRGHKPNTVNQAYYALRLYYRDHRKWKGGEWDIWDQFKVRGHKDLPHVLTQNEVAQFIGHVQKSRYRIVLLTIYLCGLRISEAVKIKPEHIHRERRVLRIHEAKGGKTREVPLCEELYQKLRNHWKAHRNPQWLFPSKPKQWRRFGNTQREAYKNSPKHMGVAALRQAFNKAAVQSGLKTQHQKFTPHSLRHSYATHLLEQGACVRSVSAYLGHTSLETTMVYLHMTKVSEAQARAVISKLATQQF